MKHVMRLVLLTMSALIVLLGVQGCQIGTPGEPVTGVLVGYLSPSQGHPPFDVTVSVQMSGGTFLYEVPGHDPVESTENTFKTTVDRWPWRCKVTWHEGDEVKTLTLTPTLINSSPVIQKPWISCIYAVPFTRTQIDLRYGAADSLHYGPCITDPEGDDWTVTAITVQCENKEEPDTLFYPSIFGIKEFHIDAGSGCDTIDVYPAAIWYPGYTAEIDSDTGLPFSLSREDGKSSEHEGDRGYPFLKHFTSPLFRAQDATITITAEDEFGASTTESFIIPIIAYTGP